MTFKVGDIWAEVWMKSVHHAEIYLGSLEIWDSNGGTIGDESGGNFPTVL